MRSIPYRGTEDGVSHPLYFLFHFQLSRLAFLLVIQPAGHRSASVSALPEVIYYLSNSTTSIFQGHVARVQRNILRSETHTAHSGQCVRLRCP